MYMIPTIKKKEHLQSVAKKLSVQQRRTLTCHIYKSGQTTCFSSRLSIKSSLGLI